MTRRMAFIALSVAGGMAPAQTAAKITGYASAGPELLHYPLGRRNASLVKRESVMLPDSVQYAWPHPSKRYIYVAWSNGSGADHHGVTAFRIDPASGALHPHGNPVSLPARPVHITTDIPGTHLLVAYNDPSGLTVYGLSPEGTILSPITQPAPLDFG